MSTSAYKNTGIAALHSLMANSIEVVIISGNTTASLKYEDTINNEIKAEK